MYETDGRVRDAGIVVLFLFSIILFIAFIFVFLDFLSQAKSSEKDSMDHGESIVIHADTSQISIEIGGRSAEVLDTFFLPPSYTFSVQQPSAEHPGRITVQRNRPLLWEYLAILLLVAAVLAVFVWGFVRLSEEE